MRPLDGEFLLAKYCICGTESVSINYDDCKVIFVNDWI